MRIAIELVWWIGVLGALAATAVIVKESLLVIGTLRRMHGLAERTHIAARGVVVHLAAAPQLAGAGERIRQLDDAVADVTRMLDGVAPRLEHEQQSRSRR